MVSLDNLKTAISAIKAEIKAETNSIKSEINRIATRYLKKTDASEIYITKDSANKSFATKSSVTKIRYFSESQDTLTKIDELRFPYFSRANKTLGTVEYNPLQSNLGNLRVAGVDNIGFVFNLPENNEADTAYLSDAGIISLIPGLSQSGLFARSDLYLRDVKKVALSNTKDEYSTLTKNQGTMYYNVRVIDRQDNSRSLSFKLSASSNPNSPRLQGMTYGKDGALYYFVSDEIYSNSTVDIPFTLTRIDRYEKLPNPNNLKIFCHGRDRVTSEEEILYDGTQARALHIYSSAVNVNLSQQGNLYHSDLAYSVIGINRDSGAFVFAKFSYGGLNYSLPLVHIDADTRRCVFIGLVNKSDYDATFMMFIGDADSPSAKLQGTIETCTVRTASAQDAIDSGKVDKVTGKGLSSNDYTAAAKAKVDAIPANPKYTDTVYDDTALKQRVATIEGKESAWDAKSDFSGSYNDLTDKPTIPTIHEYVRTEAETVARIVNQHQSNDSIVFPFLSDAHCGYYTDTGNAAATLAGQLLNQIGKRTPYDFIVHGGDFSTGAWNTTKLDSFEHIEDYTELMSEANKGVLSLWCAGNHDDAAYQATAGRVSQKELFGLVGRKNRISEAVCPNGCNYGYLDLENRKLRVIYLDTDDKRKWGTVLISSSSSVPEYLNAQNVGGAQLQWLANTALNFTDKTSPAEWDIVVVSHAALNISGTITDAVSGTVYAHNTENAAKIINAYRTGKSGSITHNGVTVNYNFATVESKATVICAVHGHNHKFCTETLTGGILSIGCPNVMNGRERASDDGNTYTKTAGTANGTSFCILTIDRENCVIYADCVGAGYDREFTYTTEVIAYTNQIPISTNTDGSVYGYKAGYRLSSSGAADTLSGSYLTGFIPVAVGDTVYMKNVTFKYGVNSGLTSANQRVSFYNASKTHVVQINAMGLAGNASGVKGDDNIWTQFTPKSNMGGVDCSSVAYFRINAAYIGDDSIITVNEPIG